MLWIMLTTLQELHGFPVRTGVDRPKGREHGAGTENWLDRRVKEQRFDDREPQVVIIGGGHGGLVLGARLRQMGVDALIIETYEWQESKQAFLPAAKWQQLPVPEKYRDALAGPAIAGFTPENRREMPPQAKYVDKTLGQRAKELNVNMMTFIMSFGVGKLLGQ